MKHLVWLCLNSTLMFSFVITHKKNSLSRSLFVPLWKVVAVYLILEGNISVKIFARRLFSLLQNHSSEEWSPTLLNVVFVPESKIIFCPHLLCWGNHFLRSVSAAFCMSCVHPCPVICPPLHWRTVVNTLSSWTDSSLHYKRKGSRGDRKGSWRMKKTTKTFFELASISTNEET